MKQINSAIALENPKINLTENQKRFQKFLNRGNPPYEKILLKYHEKRILAILKGEIVPPQELEIQPSSKCNLKCKHCFGKTLTNKFLEDRIGEKEIEVLAKKINEYKEGEFEIESVKFCGTTGEPLINPAMLHGINLFKDLGKNIVVFTNGLYLDKIYQGKKYLEYLTDINRLNVSLDAGSERTFMDLKGRIGFSRTIKSLGELIEKKNGKLKVNVSYVISEKNPNEIVKTTKLMDDLGVDEIRFRVDITNPEKIHAISGLIIYELNKAKNSPKKHIKVASVYSPNEIKEDSIFHSCGKKCFTQHLWACVGPDCNLYACGHRTYKGVEPYGSLLDHSFKELWTSEKRLENLKNLPDEYCNFCSPFSSRTNDFMTFLESIKN